MGFNRFIKRASTCLTLLATVALCTPGAAGARPPLSQVDELAALSLQHSKGSTIYEYGRGWGTFNCTVSISLTLVGTLVTADYIAHPTGGTLTGVASAHIHSATTTAAYFSGTITLSGGTGSNSHASGSASFQGTINRTSYAMTAHILGRLRL
jgi:hypothetical protein